MIVTDHEMAALSLFHWKDESVLRCFVYCVTFLMFQFSCFRTGAADIMSNEIVWLSLDSQNHFSSFEISNPTGYVSCNPHLQRFSNVSSNFIMCASTSAKPVTFCEKCGEQYQGVLDVVEEIKKVNIVKNNWRICTVSEETYLLLLSAVWRLKIIVILPGAWWTVMQ